MITIDIQMASAYPSIPSRKEFEQWISAALKAPEIATDKDTEISLRIVNEEESRRLNYTYRQQDKPTNVLSFPCEFPEGVDVPLLGDIVICAEVVAREATEQGKLVKSHWAHMFVHGTLHLHGYDHVHEEDAVEMEQLETDIMLHLGFKAPYLPSNSI